jgi:hypothetical protein
MGGRFEEGGELERRSGERFEEGGWIRRKE